MPLKASEAEEGKVYRLARGARKGEYYTVYKPGHVRLVRRLQGRRNRLNGQEAGLLALALQHPSWSVLVWHLRGTDPFTGNKFEITKIHVLPPNTVLREVKTRPGY